MLRLMRDHATSWIIKILLGAIVIVFVFWGVGNFGEQQQTKAATVNGDLITMKEYQSEYNRLVERYRQNFGGQLNEDMIKRFNLRGQALDGLIDQRVLLQEAAKLGLKVTDQELFDAIGKIDVFHKNGVFNESQYRFVLSRNRMTPEDFEFLQRNSMLQQKLRSLVINSVKVSENEILEWFKWDNTTASIDYVLFEPAKYKDITPSEEEIKAYHEENKENYKTDPEIQVQYLRFENETYKSRVKIDDEEIQDYYDENKDEFKVEKTVEARHILLKTEKDTPPEEVEKKKEKALEIMKMTKEEGKDFAELAKEYSEGPTKDKGGQLGAFKKGAMVKPFSDKAFSMKPGEISEPVLTRFGWHIIKVEKVNEEKEQTFEEAKGKITKKLADEAAKNIAYDEAEDFYDKCQVGDDLAKLAEKDGLEIIKTDFFTKKRGPHKVRNRSKFASAAFELDVMEFTNIQDFGDGYYLIQALEQTPPQLSEFKDVEKKVTADLKKQKQDEKAKQDAEEFLGALKNGETMEDAGKKYELAPKATEPFKRTGSIPDIGYEKDITETAFKLSDESKLPENVLKGRKGYYVISLKERKEPGSEEFEKEKDQVKQRLLQQKQFKTFSAWLSKVKDKYEIKRFFESEVM
ncbi:MAG: peptidyl-prolyl cis-trans isomerase [Desulfobacterales bacterium]|nr:peptidyl-prolyl cis-trans isomerase [Desulfobacterales bacterium]